jgi:hypothetical protein
MGRVDRQIAEPAEVRLHRRIELHHQIECRRAIEDPADSGAGKRRLHRLGHFVGTQPVACDRRPIEDEAHHRHVHLLLERHVDRPWHFDHDIAHVFAKSPQGGEVVAEDLHRDVRPRARQHVVDAMRDRLADGHVGAGQRREATA